MIVGAERAVALDRLDEALRLALALGPELFRKIIDGEGARLGCGRPNDLMRQLRVSGRRGSGSVNVTIPAL
jgi:hypothetical protein